MERTIWDVMPGSEGSEVEVRMLVNVIGSRRGIDVALSEVKRDEREWRVSDDEEVRATTSFEGGVMGCLELGNNDACRALACVVSVQCAYLFA